MTEKIKGVCIMVKEKECVLWVHVKVKKCVLWVHVKSEGMCIVKESIRNIVKESRKNIYVLWVHVNGLVVQNGIFRM